MTLIVGNLQSLALFGNIEKNSKITSEQGNTKQNHGEGGRERELVCDCCKCRFECFLPLSFVLLELWKCYVSVSQYPIRLPR